MKRYTIEVTETIVHTYELTAKNGDEAMQKLNDENYDEHSQKLYDSVTEVKKVEDVEADSDQTDEYDGLNASSINDGPLPD